MSFARGLLDRLQNGLRKTRESLGFRVQEILHGRTKIDDGLYEELEETLLAADMGVTTTRRLLDTVASRVRAERIEDVARVNQMLREETARLLGPAPAEVAMESQPRVILVVGVNGSGKTTTIGKLARRYAAEGKKVLVGAGDTFRAAAVEQLGVWTERAHVRLVSHREGADPAAVVYDAVDAAVAGNYSTVIIDTAGRLHTKDNLMVELEKVRRVAGKRLPGAPHEVLLVLDATTGQNALVQAREFASRVGVTGLVVTKLDGTAKGGAVVAICNELGLPVRFLGTGEGIDDLVPFDGSAFADALFAP